MRLHFLFSRQLTIFPFVKWTPFSFRWRKMENDCAVDASNGCFWLCVPNHRSLNRFGNALFFFLKRSISKVNVFFCVSESMKPPSRFRWEKQTVVNLKPSNCFAGSIKRDFTFYSTRHFPLVKTMPFSFWWRKAGKWLCCQCQYRLFSTLRTKTWVN